MPGLVDRGRGRAELPAPAWPALPARTDALTHLLALCYCKIQPGVKTRAGAALTEPWELLGFVFHTGLEQGQLRSWRQSQSSPARCPPCAVQNHPGHPGWCRPTQSRSGLLPLISTP